ncbi:MAG: hypothetical protein HYW98_01420 [Candidatus Wildermuthbacteria bacterium]|nr:hypothetical protein [Candidatus Wildermuthbacteria bacterium]
MDIIPKTDRQEWRIQYALYGAYALLFASVIAFGALKIIQSRLLNALSRADVLLAQSQTPAEKSLEEEVLFMRDRLKDAASILATASSPLPVFSAIERVVLPNIVFTSIQISMDGRRAAIMGEGSDFFTIDRQIKAMQEAQEISRLELSSLGFTGKGAIAFTIEAELAENK